MFKVFSTCNHTGLKSLSPLSNCFIRTEPQRIGLAKLSNSWKSRRQTSFHQICGHPTAPISAQWTTRSGAYCKNGFTRQAVRMSTSYDAGLRNSCRQSVTVSACRRRKTWDVDVPRPWPVDTRPTGSFRTSTVLVWPRFHYARWWLPVFGVVTSLGDVCCENVVCWWLVTLPVACV